MVRLMAVEQMDIGRNGYWWDGQMEGGMDGSMMNEWMDKWMVQ